MKKALIVVGVVFLLAATSFVIVGVVQNADEEMANANNKVESDIEAAKDKVKNADEEPDWYEDISVGDSKSSVESAYGESLKDCRIESETEVSIVELCEVDSSGYTVLLTFENNDLIHRQLLDF